MKGYRTVAAARQILTFFSDSSRPLAEFGDYEVGLYMLSLGKVRKKGLF